MVSLLTSIALPGILELIVLRAMCAVLLPRRPRLFVLAMVLVWTMRLVLQLRVINTGVLVLMLTLLHTLVLPIAFSGRTPLQRVMGQVAILTSLTVVELVAESLYSMLSGGEFFPTDFTSQALNSMVLIYMIMIAVTVPLLELTTLFFRRADDRQDAALGWPVVAFLGGSLLAESYWTARVYYPSRSTEVLVIVGLALVAVQQVCGVILIAVARGDARAQREVAARHALTRQVHHLASLISESTERTMAMRRLRHDLANQVDVVRSLAAQGMTDEADRHLLLLQEVACELAGDAHE